MIHASESCAMLTPLALAIFSTLFFFQSYIMINFFLYRQIKRKRNTRVDNFFRSCILTVAFDRSEEEDDKFLGESNSRVEVHTHRSVGGESLYHFHKDAQEDREQEGTRESHPRPSAKLC